MGKHFTAEFKLEAAKLVVDQQYTFVEAAKAMNVSLSVISPTLIEPFGLFFPNSRRNDATRYYRNLA